MAVKKKAPVKKSAPAKQAPKKVASVAKKSEKVASTKKVVAKPLSKKPVAKKAVEKPKSTSKKEVSKATTVKTANKTVSSKTVNKKSAPKAEPIKSKQTVAPKKATKVTAPITKQNKEVATKKNVPLKKKTVKEEIKPTKKVATKKVEASKPVKKEVTKKETPSKEVVAKPAKVAKPTKAATAKKGASQAVVNKIIKAVVNNSNGTPVNPVKPSPAPVGRSLREEKKSNVIVAHRKLQKETDSNSNQQQNAEYKEFNRSLLDNNTAEPIVAKRYSDEELQEFRDIINDRLENARKELAYLQGLIMRKDGAGTEDSENRFNAEDGSGAMERETVSQLASRQIQFISNLEKALMRIENKTYGICRVTGKLIDKARLKAVPHATLSIEAKTSMKK
jgi:RNA polymerase-binding transcription factor DksA